MKHSSIPYGASLLLVLAACGSKPDIEPLPKTPKGLDKVDMTVPADNPITPAKAHLGKLLFFDKRLSSNGSMSCQTCHLHEHGWTNGEASSTKVNGDKNSRNSPSLYNVGYQPKFYWDGRKDTLEGNILAAWKGHMGADPDAMAKTLNGVAGYKTLFEKAFPSAGATGETMVKALATFVRTLRSGNSAYDRGVMSADAKAGQTLFDTRCGSCHTRGTGLFTDNLFHNVGIGMDKPNPDIGRGKFDKNKIGAFKTPSLRSVAKTGPYFHDGSVKTLREAVSIMAKGGVENEHLDSILKTLRKLPPVTEKEIDQLVAFLEALTSNEPFTAPTLPQ